MTSRRSFALNLLLFLAPAAVAQPRAARPPSIGDKLPDITLKSTRGKSLRLSQLVGQGPVVLIVLRGYPGYQCPFCNRQARDFVQQAQAFRDRGAQVVMIYPGPAEKLDDRAAEFLSDKSWPDNFEMLLDPDYKFTNLYGLRWNEPSETAYPSTFLIDQRGIVFFSKVVKSHGGRTTAAEVLDTLPKMKDSR